MIVEDRSCAMGVPFPGSLISSFLGQLHVKDDKSDVKADKRVSSGACYRARQSEVGRVIGLNRQKWGVA